MRRTFRSRIRVAATIALAAFAAPAFAGSTDYLLELGGVDGESSDDKHKNQIEILSYSWGATRAHAKADALTDGLLIVRATDQPAPASTGGVQVAVGDVNGDGRTDAKKPKTTQKMLAPGATRPTSAGNVEFEWKVEEGESAPPPPGGVRVAAGDVNGDGRADIVAPRDAASGLATGKRMHKPVTFPTPRDKGSLTVRGNFPGCAVGARYPSLALSGRGKRFTLQDAIITSCGAAPGSGEALPMEEVSFNYGKIKT